MAAQSKPRGPRRRVVDAMEREATTGLLRGPRRTKRWWDLTLDCGHVVERPVRYTKKRTIYVPNGRSFSDLMPAPNHAWCELCPPNTDQP